jgi:Raf kinase inhibitor-like YbhB/YbcL family protein
MPDLELTSSAFDDGEAIPGKYSCEGENVSPPLAWEGLPAGTQSLALVVHDPDAPSGDFTHWVAWNIDPEPGHLEEGASDPGEGVNGRGEVGYMGPCPPPGHGAHRYFHQLYALDSTLRLDATADRERLKQALEGHILADARLVGIYERA